MKYNKFLIYDNGDTLQFMDLITFKKDYDLIEIQDTINKYKADNEDYTNEDIYECLEAKYEVESIEWFGYDRQLEY